MRGGPSCPSSSFHIKGWLEPHGEHFRRDQYQEHGHRYRSGDILHAEFTATKTIGKWTVGPVAYYAGQVSDDKSGAFYGGAINVNRYNIWAVGASFGYNFGPAQPTIWVLDEVSENASGGTPQLPPGPTITKGFSAFAQLSYRLWAPDERVATPKPPIYHK
jgi:hypothetical protein